MIQGVVLAGGQSTRMGQDKAMLPIAGVPMLYRIARTLSEVCGGVTVIGRERPVNWPGDLSATFLMDEGSAETMPGISGGPLIGLMTALRHTEGSILLLACDMPLVSAATLQSLLSAHSPASRATIAIHASPPHEAEPALAVYTPGVLGELERMLAQNRRSLQQLTRLPNIATWSIPKDAEWQMLNVNDQTTLLRAQALAIDHGLPRG
ncbi:MAG TPA: molybdenum cofactor guanylyltransferase [Phycisphaerae bacterium]|jgi:molybdopterin-guanine dinucleotide biosynthesis protein A